MLEISQDINREFTPDIPLKTSRSTTTFTPTEMLAISEEISQNYSPSISDDTPHLMLLPVDPEHLYAYWNVAGENAPNMQIEREEPLTLRIFAERPRSINPEISQSKVCFDIAVENSRMQQQVRLPGLQTDTAYSAAIGKRGSNDSFAILANSNSIHIPRSHKPAAFGLGEQVDYETIVQSFLNDLSRPARPCETVSNQGYY